MSDDVFSQALRSFISRHVSSVEQLEILCLLNSKPGGEWTAATVYKVVQSSHASIEQGLKKFTDAGFLNRSSSTPAAYCIDSSPEIRQMIGDLCRLYAERPVRVIEAIYQKQSSPVQGFADAFKFKKPEP
jgi:hypothetical protein